MTIIWFNSHNYSRDRLKKREPVTKAGLSNSGSVLWSTTATALHAKHWLEFLPLPCFPSLHPIPGGAGKNPFGDWTGSVFQKSLQYSLQDMKTAFGGKINTDNINLPLWFLQTVWWRVHTQGAQRSVLIPRRPRRPGGQCASLYRPSYRNEMDRF